MNDDRFLFRDRKMVPGPKGTMGTVRVDIPVPHYTLWGQRVEMFTRKTGFTEVAGSFKISARFWRSGEIDFDLSSKLDTGELEGDSFLKAGPTFDLAVGSGGPEHDITIITNAKGRIAGFEFGPMEAPSCSLALAAGEKILGKFQRAAALAGVPLFCPTMRAWRPDMSESNAARLFPYPDMDLPPPTQLPYPIMETLVTALAEGRCATSVFYRALVFFKIVDTFIESIKPKLNRALHDLGQEMESFELSFPPDPFQKISPPLVGVKCTKYRDAVRNRIRDVIAHLDPDSPIVAFDVRAETEVRTVSIALHYCATEIVSYVERQLQAIEAKDAAAAQTLTYRGIDKRRKRTRNHM